MQRSVEAQGWRCLTRRTHEISASARNGRKLILLQPLDADDVYVLSHRCATAVLVMGPSPVIMIDPSSAPVPGNLIPLDQFARYKAFLGRFGVRHDRAATLKEIETWMGRATCVGERDARCLPMHVFAPSVDWVDLESEEGQGRFEVAHGGPNARKDHASRLWPVAHSGAMHGGHENQYVGGVQIRSGFHWDVAGSRSGGARLTTAREVWKVADGRYCNVYPNSRVRKGAGGKSASLVFEAARPAEIAEPGRRQPSRASTRRRSNGR